MTTKAEWFAYFAARAHPRPGAGADAPPHAKAALQKTPRSESKRLTRKATYALEECDGRASRRSTRKGANRQRTDGQFRSKRRQSEAAPRPLPAPR